MKHLTKKEQKTFNNLSHVRSVNVSLGDKIQEIISTTVTKGTPVNAVPATSTLTVSGVVVSGETVTIDNPLVENSDVYEFLVIDSEEDVPADPDNIVVDVTAKTAKAKVVLTVDTQPTAGDTMVIGTVTYKFVTAGTEADAGDISIGAALAGAQEAIIAAINGTDGLNEPHPLVTISDFDNDEAEVVAKSSGAAGNAIVSTSTFTAATNKFATATLLNGADCSNTNAIALLVAAVNEFDTQMVSAEASGTTVVFRANIGKAGNNIAIAEDMTNGSLNRAKFEDGVDGTTGIAGAMMVDTAYFYVAIDENTISGANWRRVSLGSVF